MSNGFSETTIIEHEVNKGKVGGETFQGSVTIFAMALSHQKRLLIGTVHVSGKLNALHVAGLCSSWQTCRTSAFSLFH